MHRRDFILSAAAVAIASESGCAAHSRSALARRDTDAASYAAERRFAELSVGRIAYVDRGNGPGALFLHGFPVNGYQWRGALDRLSRHRRCIVPDFMGLGYSEPLPGQDLRAGAQTDMVVALLDRLGVQTVDVV